MNGPPILNFIQDIPLDQFVDELSKYGACSEFCYGNKLPPKNSIFVGNIVKIFEPISPDKRSSQDWRLVLTASDLTRVRTDHGVIRIAFIGNVVKELVQAQLKKGGVIAVLNPNCMKISISDSEITSLIVGPFNVVAWLYRPSKTCLVINDPVIDSHLDGHYPDFSDDTDLDPNYSPSNQSVLLEENTILRDMDETFEARSDKDSSSSFSMNRNNDFYRNKPVNLKEISKKNSEIAKVMKRTKISVSKRLASVVNKPAQKHQNNVKKHYDVNNDQNIPSQNTAVAGSVGSSARVEFMNPSSATPKHSGSNSRNKQQNSGCHVSPPQQPSPMCDFLGGLPKCGEDCHGGLLKSQDGCHGRLPKCGEGCHGLTKCGEGCHGLPKHGEGCHRLPKHGEDCHGLPKCGEGCRGLLKCGDGCHRLTKHEEDCHGLPKCRKGRFILPSCFPLGCYACICRIPCHSSLHKCLSHICPCQHQCNSHSDFSHGTVPTVNAPCQSNNKKRNNLSCLNSSLKIPCCSLRNLSCHVPTYNCPYQMSCSSSMHVSVCSSEKSCCNFHKSYFNIENSCHTNCCLNFSYHSRLHHCNMTSAGQEKVRNEYEHASPFPGPPQATESYQRTEEWVMQSNPTPPQPCEQPVSTASSSTSLMHVQNIIEPIRQNDFALGDREKEKSNAVLPQSKAVPNRKRKLFNLADSSNVFQEENPVTVVEESTPFSSEENAQNPQSGKSVPTSIQLQAEKSASSSNQPLAEKESVPISSQEQIDSSKSNYPAANGSSFLVKRCAFTARPIEKSQRTSEDMEITCLEKIGGTSVEKEFAASSESLEDQMCKIIEISSDEFLPDLRATTSAYEGRKSPNSLDHQNDNHNTPNSLQPSANYEIPDSSSDAKTSDMSLENNQPSKKKKLSSGTNPEPESASESIISASPIENPVPLNDESDSEVSEKSNETHDLGQERINSKDAPEVSQVGGSKPINESKDSPSSRPTSSVSSFYDAQSNVNQSDESRSSSAEKWIMKPVNNLSDYLKIVERLSQLKATLSPTGPLNFVLYKPRTVIGIIINFIPDLGNPLSIIYGMCHERCKKSFKYEEFSEMDFVQLRTCPGCRQYFHAVCPKCSDEGLRHYLCVYYSFEIHLLVGENVIRIEVDHKSATDFMGLPPSSYVRCYEKVLPRLKKIIISSPPQSRDSLVQLKANIKAVHKNGIMVLVLHQTCLKKDLIRGSTQYKYIVPK